MRHYYTQIRAYMEKLVQLIIRTDREEIKNDGVSVNLMEYLLLKNLSRSDGQTFQEIMENTDSDRNAITAMMRRLIKQNVIQKEPATQDRRVRRLVLTESGQRLIDQTEASEKQLLDGLLEDFSFNEEKAVLKFLVKLEMLDRLGEMAETKAYWRRETRQKSEKY